jgi:hypothetical protein
VLKPVELLVGKVYWEIKMSAHAAASPISAPDESGDTAIRSTSGLGSSCRRV